MMLEILSTGDTVHLFHKNLVIPFRGKRKVLSNSVINGGYQEDLLGVFNNDCNPGSGMAAKLKGATYESHMAVVAEEMGLHPEKSAGLCTAAAMKNVAIAKERFQGLEVTAILTGGIEHNGGRVGDPASYWDWEEQPQEEERKLGTINTILVIDANLPAHTMVRALITATEAKTAVLQELMAPSCYSTGLATGSGTDGTIIVSNAESALVCQDAGKHGKLGELIGRTVKKALKETLFKQNGLSPQSQHSIFRRLKRYALTEEKIWQFYRQLGEGSLAKPDFMHQLFLVDRQEGLLPLIVQLIHLLDELNWGLLEKREVWQAGTRILHNIEGLLAVKRSTTINLEDLEASILGGLQEILAKAGGGIVNEGKN